MDPRVRREVIRQGLMELSRIRGAIFDFEALPVAARPEHFRFKFKLRSVMDLRNGSPVYSRHGHIHIVAFVPSSSYPEVVTVNDIRFETQPILHPNVYRDGRICIGDYLPSESLGSFALRIARMIKFDPAYINEENAANSSVVPWYLQNLHRFPVDDSVLPSLNRSDGFVPGFIQGTIV